MKLSTRSLLLSSVLALAACGDESDGDEDTKQKTPAQLAISADWLNNTISYIDYAALSAGKTTRAEVVTRTIDVSAYAPGAFALELTPDKKRLLVSCSTGFFAIPGSGFLIGENALPSDTGTMLVYDVESAQLIKQIDTGEGPMGVAITPDGKRAFVAHFTSGDVALVDLDSLAVTERVAIGMYPEEITLDDTGTVGVVGYGTAGSVMAFAASEFKASLTDVPLQGDSAGVAFFPGTKIAFVAQAPNPLSPSAGYTILDVSNPRTPRVLEDVRKQALDVAYPALPAPDRGTVLLPITRGGKLLVEEYKLSGEKAVVSHSVEVANANLLAVLGFAYDGKGSVVMALTSQRAVAVTNLTTGATITVPWEQMRAGPSDIVIR